MKPIEKQLAEFTQPGGGKNEKQLIARVRKEAEAFVIHASAPWTTSYLVGGNTVVTTGGVAATGERDTNIIGIDELPADPGGGTPKPHLELVVDNTKAAAEPAGQRKAA